MCTGFHRGLPALPLPHNYSQCLVKKLSESHQTHVRLSLTCLESYEGILLTQDGFPRTLKPAAHQPAPLTMPIRFSLLLLIHPIQRGLLSTAGTPRSGPLHGHPPTPTANSITELRPFNYTNHQHPHPRSLRHGKTLTVQFTTCAKWSFRLNMSSLLDQLHEGRNFHFASCLAQGWHMLALNEHTCDESSGRAHCRVTQQCRTMNLSIST